MHAVLDCVPIDFSYQSYYLELIKVIRVGELASLRPFYFIWGK